VSRAVQLLGGVAAVTTRVAIDPNIRVRGNGTFAGLEDVSGPLVLGDTVEVYESEANIVGSGTVTEIDLDKQLVYLSVDWASLRDAEPQGEGEWSGTDFVIDLIGQVEALHATQMQQMILVYACGAPFVAHLPALQNAWSFYVWSSNVYRLAA